MVLLWFLWMLCPAKVWTTFGFKLATACPKDWFPYESLFCVGDIATLKPYHVVLFANFAVYPHFACAACHAPLAFSPFVLPAISFFPVHLELKVKGISELAMGLGTTEMILVKHDIDRASRFEFVGRVQCPTGLFIVGITFVPWLLQMKELILQFTTKWKTTRVPLPCLDKRAAAVYRRQSQERKLHLHVAWLKKSASR
jgi:hypothetical protein